MCPTPRRGVQARDRNGRFSSKCSPSFPQRRFWTMRRSAEGLGYFRTADPAGVNCLVDTCPSGAINRESFWTSERLCHAHRVSASPSARSAANERDPIASNLPDYPTQPKPQRCARPPPLAIIPAAGSDPATDPTAPGVARANLFVTRSGLGRVLLACTPREIRHWPILRQENRPGPSVSTS